MVGLAPSYLIVDPVNDWVETEKKESSRGSLPEKDDFPVNNSAL